MHTQLTPEHVRYIKCGSEAAFWPQALAQGWMSDPMSMNGNQSNTGGPAELQENLTGLGELEDILCKIFCWCDEEGNDGADFVDLNFIEKDFSLGID